ncbi:hypothetical protein OOT00_06340 [Desulfobotulus sp. H1]|uniref:DUF4292 domain-containing protein n=1 Tax=Desulfobotulus pelophilus TaxID=2823377 RepID=A0ABT3N831_9BACT|nr:hypothetical protein [Desulfobotulus pelophilus]MCW7753607.1 hypothetical protein [Desulfobotulus pelophilus]
MTTAFRFILCLAFMAAAAACSRTTPMPMDSGAIPAVLQARQTLPQHFTGRAVLTLPENLPPGGTLQLAYAVSHTRGIRIAALSPMGTPVMEMTAGPDQAAIRDSETGKIHRAASLSAITRRLMGLSLDMDELSRLLAGEIPLPRWTSVVYDGPSTFLLVDGRHVQARIALDESGEILRMERLRRRAVLYTLTTLSDNPRVWEIESGEYILRLRIRQITPADPIDPSVFRLTTLSPPLLPTRKA